ncbi:mucin-16-like [Ochotona princeps]|uniref:mucin-16-like n=1 Tax=Ochotona princeps TaxID=9978 RepID=UPI0027145D57|nr:mucin-16-like [Ochotona princeps]
MVESADPTLSVQAGHSLGPTQRTHSGDTSTPTIWTGTPSTLTYSIPHSEETALGSVSRTSTLSVTETTSESSPSSSPVKALTPESSMLAQDNTLFSQSIPSPLTSGLNETTHDLSMSPVLVTSPPPFPRMGSREASSSEGASSTAETRSDLSESPATAMTKVSKTELFSSQEYGAAPPAESPQTLSRKSSSFSNPLDMMEPAKMTTINHAGSPGTITQSTITGEKPTMTWWAGTTSVETRNSEMTSLPSTGPENVSRASTTSVGEAASHLASLSPSAINSWLSVSSTVTESSTSSPLIVTSGLMEITEVLSPIPEPESSLSPHLTSAPANVLTSSEVKIESQQTSSLDTSGCKYFTINP